MKKLSPKEIEVLLSDVGDIPTLPSIATTIMEKTLEANVNAKQIAQMVERDQALALKVLRVANSPFYRRIKEISTIRGAVVLLGFNVLKSIVLSISVINLFNDKEKKTLDLYQFWQHSIACAVCAKAIAAKVSPMLTEDAFIAGLLHDLGKMVADQMICKKGEYKEVIEIMNRSNADIIEIEQRIVGIDHATLGKFLTERWNLPLNLSKSVGYHHNISELKDDKEAGRLCCIVHVADIVTNHLGLGLTQDPTGFVDPDTLNQIQLTSNDIQEISIELKDNISSISEEMGIPKAEPKTYFEVLQSANAQLGKLSLDLEQKKLSLERRTIELSGLNQMNAQLQSSMKLSEITNIITSHSLTILNAQKIRCLIRLNNMRILATESFWLSKTPHTRTGVASATKELLGRTKGLYPKGIDFIYAPIKTSGGVIGVIEAIPGEGQSPDDVKQVSLLMRTISEVGSQALQRAMLITQNIKAQRLAAVSKTAIAANHEINSPLTTIILKLDMLMKNSTLDKDAEGELNEIKTETLKIKNVVKKMLEISDVVDTNYTQNEKMLDLNPSKQKKNAPHTTKGASTPDEDLIGFEDYLEPKEPSTAKKDIPQTQDNDDKTVPGFEDYLEKKKLSAKNKGKPTDNSTDIEPTPGFEDYFEGEKPPTPKKETVANDDVPGFEDYLDK